MLRAKYTMYPYESQLIIIQQGDANTHSSDTSKIVDLGTWGCLLSKLYLKCLRITEFSRQRAFGLVHVYIDCISTRFNVFRRLFHCIQHNYLEILDIYLCVLLTIDVQRRASWTHHLLINGAKERHKIIKADLMIQGSFDGAMDGDDGVFHAASPVVVPYDENVQKEQMPEYCVTGGTGFIAAYLVKVLLEKGHTVRATVRNPGDAVKVGFLWELQGANERLKLMKAELMEEGSFDEAFEGVDGVFHTASPVSPPPYGDNVQEILIDPAIKGTVNVLNSCIKAGVKRVVLTSSTKTIRIRDDDQLTFSLNESHWSDAGYCKRHKMFYVYAKTLAEKEGWKIAKESGLDLVAVLPSFVVGPMLAPEPTSSLLILLSIIKGSRGVPDEMVGFVHIDDVVSAHILAMEESKASGRLICSGSEAHWSEIMEMLKAKYSYHNQLSSDQKRSATPLSYDTTKVMKLGLSAFKTIPQMFDDCITSFKHKGFL